MHTPSNYNGTGINVSNKVPKYLFLVNNVNYEIKVDLKIGC